MAGVLADGLRMLLSQQSVYGNGNANHHLGRGFLLHKGITLAVKKVVLASDRISYISLRGRWCDIVILSMHQHLRLKVMI